jgi:hypothetical protein
MQETFRNELFETFVLRLQDLYPNLTEAECRSISTNLSTTALALMIDNGKKLRELIAQAVLDKEQHALMFKNHIEFIQAQTRVVIKDYIDKGIVEFYINPKTNKQEMRARSTALQATITYFNALNDQVKKFYKEVYKITDGDTPQQTNLF